MHPTFFKTALAFRTWLEKNYLNETALIVGFYKLSSKKASLTWSESVDQAICFGWIDGVRRSIDEESYSVRFTPRKKNSIWSSINIQKVAVLKQAGLMTEAGLKAFSYRTENKSNIYPHEKNEIKLAINYENTLKANIIAWDFFNKQTPVYKKHIAYWIMSAKQEKTRVLRLEKLIEHCTLQKKIF